MRTVSVTCELQAPADVVWPAVKTPHAFVHVSKGMLRYPVSERLTRPWRSGDNIEGWVFLFGFVPFARHHLRIESIDDHTMTLTSMENGGVVRRWRHRLVAVPINERRCRYEDHIEIDAGLLTPVAAAFAVAFYKYRQRRWRDLARLLEAMTEATGAPS